jgi:hypothetical protein
MNKWTSIAFKIEKSSHGQVNNPAFDTPCATHFNCAGLRFVLWNGSGLTSLHFFFSEWAAS